MKYTVRFTREQDDFLRKMAKEAGVSTSDIIEIAAFNLIALYLQNQNQIDNPEPDDADSRMADAEQLLGDVVNLGHTVK